MDDSRYGSTPLGKSVEEVEQESGERGRRPTDADLGAADGSVMVPAVAASNMSPVPAVVPVLHGEAARPGHSETVPVVTDTTQGEERRAGETAEQTE